MNRNEVSSDHTSSRGLDDDVNIVKSSLADQAKRIKIPDVPVPELIFQAIDLNYDIMKNRIWVTDIDSGKTIKFSDIKPMSRKIASALTRLGFKKGDVLYYVTYETALIYLVNMGVWLCGGAIRSCYQRERKELYVSQMKEVSAHFILCDPETSDSIKWAANQLSWSVTILSIGGEVEGALSIEELIKNEDCSAFPTDLKINTKDDALTIINTSGSTGIPKGVITTHSNYLIPITMKGLPRKLNGTKLPTLLTAVGNHFATVLEKFISTIMEGCSFYTTSTLDPKMFMTALLKYKPETVYLHPHGVHAFLQLHEIESVDLTFVKVVISAGSVFSYATAKTLEAKLPHAKLLLMYGATETGTMADTKYDTYSALKDVNPEDRVAGVKFKTIQEDRYLTCGQLFPLVSAKVVDPSTGCTLGRNVKGKLLIKTSNFMKGYLPSEENKDITVDVDDNGWYDTGDIAFFDEDERLYVVDRNKYTFKHHGHWVSPTEVEAIILKHPAVVSAVVVGVPDSVTTSAAKAFVVLKPGSKVTEEEIKLHVADKTAEYKHLHGGVTFLDSIPFNAGGKIDRCALLKKAIEEKR